MGAVLVRVIGVVPHQDPDHLTAGSPSSLGSRGHDPVAATADERRAGLGQQAPDLGRVRVELGVGDGRAADGDLERPAQGELDVAEKLLLLGVELGVGEGAAVAQRREALELGESVAAALIAGLRCAPPCIFSS